MNSKNKLSLLLFVFLSFVVYSSYEVEAFPETYLRGEFPCDDPYTLRYYGTVDENPAQGIGTENEEQFNTYFLEHMKYTSTCLPGFFKLEGDARKDNVGGVLFGGFLYVVQEQNMAEIELGSQGPYDNHNVYAGFSHLLLEVPSTSFEALKNGISIGNFKEKIKEFELGQSLYVYEGGLGSTRENWNIKSYAIPRNDISPGLYFIQGGLERHHTRRNTNQKSTSQLKPLKFSEQTDYDLDANLNNIDDGYIVTNRPLNTEELNSVFGEKVEELSYLCTLAGGEHKVAYNQETNEEYGICCGNTPDDEGMIHFIEGKEDRCVKDADNNFAWSIDKDACEQIEPLPGDYIASVQIDYAAIDGSDGCCGDDVLDIGYISTNGEYFCNRDQADNGAILPEDSEDASNKYWDTSNPYKIHEIVGTDYITNGDSWYECSPKNSNETDNLIGNDEEMPEPLSELIGFSTCVENMNFLLEQNAFDVHEPGVNDRFETSSTTNSQEDWTCDPQVTTDMNNFFSSSTISCVESCFTSSGKRVSSLNATREELIEYLCGFGLLIPACPDYIEPPGGDDVGGDSSGTYDASFANEDCRSIINEGGYSGYLCATPYTYCETRNFYSTEDTDLASGVSCCKAPTGSDYFDVCTDPGVVEEDEGTIVLDTSYNPSEQFSCSAWNEESRFLECCGETLSSDQRCFGSEVGSLHYQLDGSTNGMFVTAGGSTYLIEDFNKYEAGILVDESLVVNNFNVNNPLLFDIERIGLSQRDVSDWSGFRRLEFDVKYTIDLLSDPFEFVLVYDTPNEENVEYRTILRNHMVTGTSGGKFQHVLIDLPIDITRAKYLGIETSSELLGIQIEIDHIFLNNHISGEEELYCGGDFNEWLTNLDGVTDQGFDINAKPVEYGAYQQACNAIPSFGWTGRLCCGDDTSKTAKETYKDEAAGCFEGNVVNNNQVVSIATKEESHNDLLFSQGEFYYCDAGEESPYEIVVNTHGNYVEESIYQAKPVGEIIENYACTENGEWINLGEISKTKILASYMYGVISQEESYSLHCQNLVNVSPSASQSEATTYFGEENIDAFCAAQVYEQQPSSQAGNRTLLGFMLSEEQSQELFLDAMSTYLIFLGLLEAEEKQDFIKACDLVEISSNNNFFSCEPTGNDNRLRLLVAPQDNIYLFSYVEHQNFDFGGLFETNTLGDYFDNVLYFFTNIFTGWYQEKETDLVDVRLPNIIASSSYEIDSLVIQSEQMEDGERKSVIGIIEKEAIEYKQEDLAVLSDLVVVEYRNFNTSFYPFARRYYGDVNELNYQKGENRQVIQFGIEAANQRKYSFEPAFDWRLITSALRIQKEVQGSFVTSRLNDGVLDIGEDCDTGRRVVLNDDGTIVYEADGITPVVETFEVFKNMDGNTCANYLPNVYGFSDKNISCRDGIIDISACNFCGDGEENDEEQCDDGNNINGDGCDSLCQLEFCGDGFVNNVNEVCDDGNTIDEGYQAIICSQVSNCNSQCNGYSGCIGDSICQEQESCESNPLLGAHPDCGYCDGDGDGFDVSIDCDDTNPIITLCVEDSDSTNPIIDVCSPPLEFERLEDCNAFAFSYYEDGLCHTCELQDECYVVIPVENTGLGETTCVFSFE